MAKDLGNYITKTKEAGGYYIGRYEVGDKDTTEARNFTDNTSHPEATPVIKKGKWPYTFVNQADAATLAKNLYNSNNNFESDLINGYAWDTAIVFIQTFSDAQDYSKKGMFQSILLTTGNVYDSDNNYDVKCNIYDMGGNPYEWSTETSLSGRPCTNRGGTYMFGGRTGDRYPNSSGYSYASTGFRPILYV